MCTTFGRTRSCVTVLLIMEVCIGVIIIAVTAIYQYFLGFYMGEGDRKVLGGQFFNTYVLGCQLIVTYVASINMWNRIWQCDLQSSNLNLIIAIWMFFCFLIVLCGFATIWSLFSCADIIEGAAEASQMKGIESYYMCPEWKLFWDELQYRKQCCGVHTYKDWMEATWMPKDKLDEYCPDPDPTRKNITVAPYACCKRDCNACFENYPSQHSGHHGIPYLGMNQINMNGCLSIFAKNLRQVIYILIVLIIIAFKLDLTICCMAKYMIRNQNMDGSDYECLDEAESDAVIYIKCPSNMRCVTINDDNVASPCSPNNCENKKRNKQVIFGQDENDQDDKDDNDEEDDDDDDDDAQADYNAINGNIRVKQAVVEERIPMKPVPKRRCECPNKSYKTQRILH